MDYISQEVLDANEFSEPFPVPFIGSKILDTIRHLLEMQTLFNRPFETVPAITSIKLGSSNYTLPTYLIKRNYEDLFKPMNSIMLIQLFHAASSLGCEDLRYGICYEILVRLWNDNVLMKFQVSHDHNVESYLNYFQQMISQPFVPEIDSVVDA